jgi:helix-turn-helix protein
MAAPPSPSAARWALAKRLRELRDSGFPGVKVTQEELAHALSREEPVGNSTLSSWENAGALPKRERLSSYARFFATPRSMEGQRRRIVSPILRRPGTVLYSWPANGG